MGRKTYTPEHVISKLQEAKVLINQANTVWEASGKIEVTQQTHCRRRIQYGGVRIEQARRLKELEKENRMNAVVLQNRFI